MPEQRKRKPRIPLTKEELFYVIELKKLKQAQKIAAFKASKFYNILNKINIALVALITYCALSVLIASSWTTSTIREVEIHTSKYNPEAGKRVYTEVEISTTNNEHHLLKSDNLYTEPKKGDLIFLAKDFLFRKTVALKFENCEEKFYPVFSYATLTLCFFVLAISIFIYLVDKHLTSNGLLMCCGLAALTLLYYLLL